MRSATLHFRLSVVGYKRGLLNENLLTDDRKVFRRKTEPITDNHSSCLNQDLQDLRIYGMGSRESECFCLGVSTLLQKRYNMDKQGNIWMPEEVQQRLGELTGAEDIPRKHSPDEQCLRDEHRVSEGSPRKMSLSEYMSSPEFQRRQKIASERIQQSAFQRKMAFRSAQEQNPIKGRPRRKRGRKRR